MLPSRQPGQEEMPPVTLPTAMTLPTGFLLNPHSKNKPPRRVSMFIVTVTALSIFYGCFARARGEPYFSWDKEELMFV